MQPNPNPWADPHAYLFDDGDRTMAEVTRLERQVADLRATSAGTPNEALRVALIDDLQDMIGRLRTLQGTVRGLLRQSDTTRTALTAYRRATTIRGT